METIQLLEEKGMIRSMQEMEKTLLLEEMASDSIDAGDGNDSITGNQGR